MVAKQDNGKQKSKVEKLTLLDLKGISFQLEDKILNVEDASDVDFDVFIRQYVEIAWSLEERRDALNLALEKGTLTMPPTVDEQP